MKLSAAFRDGASRLENSGAILPGGDAECLLRHVLNIDRSQLYLEYQRELTDTEIGEYFDLINRRANREPLDYILGHCEFFGLNLKVTPRVLIPRPETELLVDKALHIAEGMATPVIVDVGTGSGNIAICLAKELSKAKIYALDISEEALSVARVNIVRNGVPNIIVAQSDLLKSLQEKADIITANLPYVPTAEINNDHEPRLAFDGGVDGLDIIKSLIATTKDKLNDGGVLLLEIGFGQSESIHEALTSAGFVDIKILNDLADIPRVVIAHI